jgi:hypothetical protein
MFQILSIEAAAEAPIAAGELASRMASLKRALRLLEPHGHGPSCDEDEFEAIELKHESARLCFDRRSERAVEAAAAGLDAVVTVRHQGLEPHPAAVDLVALAIRDGLAELSELLRR